MVVFVVCFELEVEVFFFVCLYVVGVLVFFFEFFVVFFIECVGCLN